MGNIVILGAGTGGAIIANMLSSKLNLKDWHITIIDKAKEHHYQPAYLFAPFKFYGYEKRESIARDITEPLPASASFVNEAVKRINHAKKQVKTTHGSYDYDWLICSLGCHIVPPEIEGLEAALRDDDRVNTFYTLDDAIRFQAPLEKMTSGKLLINIADMPIKCPVAPIEFSFLADYYFSERGVRDDIEITLVTPYSGAFTKPNANRILSGIAEKKRINIVPNFTLESVDAKRRTIISYEGDSLEYDLLCVVPPNLGPEVIDKSGLGDGTGYALTDPRTLKCKKADHIYILGDNTNVATSKAGSVAHFEAETIVTNILREMEGKKPLPSFDGHANCFVESGYNKALLLDFNYDMEPLEGTFPMPLVGPFSLLKESHINHMGKLAFDWVYWNMLLPGYLPEVPLLPSHMDFMGKDLTTTPQLRHAATLKIKDVMSKAPVTVKQGTSLTKAANLLIQNNVSGLPVVDVNDKLIGVVTEADFLSTINIKGNKALQNLFKTIIRRGRKRKRMGSKVDDIMTKNPLTAKEDDSLQRAIELMDRNHIKRLIITDSKKHVKGVVSRPDLVHLFLLKH